MLLEIGTGQHVGAGTITKKLHFLDFTEFEDRQTYQGSDEHFVHGVGTHVGEDTTCTLQGAVGGVHPSGGQLGPRQSLSHSQ